MNDERTYDDEIPAFLETRSVEDQPLEDTGEVRVTAEPSTRRTEPTQGLSLNPAMSIGERMAAIQECTLQLDALYRRIEEHAGAISVKATVLRREL